jgi:hypothetical protein
MALANANKQHGYIDEWACQVGYNHTLNKTIPAGDDQKNAKKRDKAIQTVAQQVKKYSFKKITNVIILCPIALSNVDN